ncbi:hypothetical protein PInf_010099 [Phytophthora infestans]|nr:hypothetical protein PInf_010099 [Phytophthora infestans]
MECVVDFKVVWPLLRKDGSNYLKPGCKIRGGKQGMDFFNGEDALLAHVKADKGLCARLNLSNIMTVESRKSADKMSEDMQTPNKKKKTKKQEAKEATERHRQLSSVTNIWGDANAQDSVDTPNDVDGHSGDGSESEYEDPPNAVESEGEHEEVAQNLVAECDYREHDEGEEDAEDASLWHSAVVETHFEPLLFDDAEPSDPNLVFGDVEKSIESNGEGEDSVGVADMLGTDDEAEALVTESVVAESSRVAGLLNEVELERLHMAVEGSSEAFDDNRLADMAARG